MIIVAPFQPRPNAPAHRERPKCTFSALAEAQRGRDAVARLVRVVFAARLFPHSLFTPGLFLSLGFSCVPWFLLPNLSCRSFRFDFQSLPSASHDGAGSGVVVVVVAGFSRGALSSSSVQPSKSSPWSSLGFEPNAMAFSGERRIHTTRLRRARAALVRCNAWFGDGSLGGAL